MPIWLATIIGLLVLAVLIGGSVWIYK